MKETQHARILKLHENREWVCQAEYHIISWCPHKRRTDICEGRAKDLEGNKIPAGLYHFEERPCQHNIKRSKDYLLVRNLEEVKAFHQLGDAMEEIWTPKMKEFIELPPLVEQAEKLPL